MTGRRPPLPTAMATLCGIGTLVSMAVIVALFIRQRPIPGLVYLLIPVAPMMVAALFVVAAWLPATMSETGQQMRRRLLSGLGVPRALLFGVLAFAGLCTVLISGPEHTGFADPALPQRFVAGIALYVFAIATALALAVRANVMKAGPSA